MLPILVVHGQLDDERGVTCHFASLACSLRPLFQTAGGRWHGDASYTQDHIVAQAQRAVPRA